MMSPSADGATRDGVSPPANLSPQTSDSRDKCPVDHRNMSQEELTGFMTQFQKQQPSDTKLGHDASQQASVRRESSSSGSDKCPVDHKNMSKDDLENFMAKHRQSTTDLGKHPKGSEASVESGSSAKMFDVYAQEIDPANMMPATPNQLPSPGQKVRLSTDRVSSSIPKSGETEGTTWTYPSPQMFFNALKRKGKADDVQEMDMSSVVAIHNRMNERTWREVQAWERRFHCKECSNPKLRRFMGKPHDLSPTARFRSTFRGYPAPFDRHDWIVDRCGLQDVRYVIDYYYREQADTGEPIEVHVRPALDSPGAIFDRLRYGLGTFTDALLGSASPQNSDDSTSVDVLSPGHVNPVAGRSIALESIHASPSPRKASGTLGISTGAIIGDEEFAFLGSLTPAKIDDISDDVKRDCAKIGALVSDSNNDATALDQANIALNYCMAKKICPRQSASFMSAMESAPGSEQVAYEDMTACLERFHIMARRVLLQAAGVTHLGPER
jgi:cytochrome c heme-lyase